MPIAPELGLFLVECMFPAYNRKWSATHDEVSLARWKKEADEFRDTFIYPHMARTESKEHVFANWLSTLNDRNYPDFVLARAEAKGLLDD